MVREAQEEVDSFRHTGWRETILHLRRTPELRRAAKRDSMQLR
jgi:hypothetical protein